VIRQHFIGGSLLLNEYDEDFVTFVFTLNDKRRVVGLPRPRADAGSHFAPFHQPLDASRTPLAGKLGAGATTATPAM
jgi:hypothetical protein